MGAVAARMLIEHVESPDALPPRRATFDAELVARASVRTLDPPRSRTRTSRGRVARVIS